VHRGCRAGKLQKEARRAALGTLARSAYLRRYSRISSTNGGESSSTIAAMIACFSNMNESASATRVKFAYDDEPQTS
jgi:hypothetical protein